MLRQGHLLQGRYRVLRELGQGGMGAVYEATDEKFGTPVALKEIIFEPADAQQRNYLAAAFEREAKSLATARHECIPFVRDYFQETDREYLIMELVEGDDLGHLLDERRRPFSVEEGIEWLHQLLDALDYLHNLDPPIIHRDIKPQNLKVSSRNRLKLLDFGIAKSGDRTMVTTRKQTFIGATLDYSPIEQIMRVIDATFREFILLKHRERAEAVLGQVTDERADIFSTGGTFYHLLTYQIPEDATRRTLAVWEGDADPLPHPTEVRPSIPRPFGDLIMKAMSIDREERFQSADEMLRELERVAADIRNTARPGDLVEASPTQAKTVRLLDEPVLHFDHDSAFGKQSGTIEPTSAETNWGLVNDTDPNRPFAELIANGNQSGAESGDLGLITNWAPINLLEGSDEVENAQTNWRSPGVTEPAMPRHPNAPSSESESRISDFDPSNAKAPDSGSFVFSSALSNTPRNLSRFIVPAAGAVFAFVILGIGLVIWISSSMRVPNPNVSNEPIRSSVPPAEPPAPAAIEPAPVVDPTPNVFSFPSSHTEPKTEPSKTAVQKQAKSNEKKPTSATKQKPSQDPNCIYTDSCK